MHEQRRWLLINYLTCSFEDINVGRTRWIYNHVYAYPRPSLYLGAHLYKYYTLFIIYYRAFSCNRKFYAKSLENFLL